MCASQQQKRILISQNSFLSATKLILVQQIEKQSIVVSGNLVTLKNLQHTILIFLNSFFCIAATITE